MEKRPLYSAVNEWLTNYKRNSVKAATYDRLLNVVVSKELTRSHFTRN